MERWEIKKPSYFLPENLVMCSKPFCFSAMLEKELYAGMSWKCIVALMRKSLRDLKCAVSYEHAGASFQGQYLGSL